MERSWLNEYERIYLAFDGDEAGRRATQAVAKLFDPNKIYDIRFTGRDRKDANDYLRNGEREELVQLWTNARRYVPEQIISTFPEFEKVLNETPKNGISYPWPTLNYMTYGIRTGESVLITAQEGVGKTEVARVLAAWTGGERNTPAVAGCVPFPVMSSSPVPPAPAAYRPPTVVASGQPAAIARTSPDATVLV